MWFTTSAWAQEEEDFLELAPEIPLEKSSDAKDFPRNPRLRIQEPKAIPRDQDHPLLRRQGQSLIPWKDLKETEFLSIRRWIAERAERDKDPLWKVKLRLDSQPEQVGKVISCIGSCILHRGTVPNRVRWLSRVDEGDEITTGTDSYLWMMLTDGTLVRLSPQTSIAVLEMNVSQSQFFFHARLNQGHMHWRPRTPTEADTSGLTETDRIFLPIMERTANLEFFQRDIYGKLTEDEKTAILPTELYLKSQKAQHAAIAELMTANNKFATVPHRALIVMPNGTATLQNSPMTFFYPAGGKALVKFAAVEGQEDARAELYYRGYTNTEKVSPTADQWMEFSPDGRTISAATEVPPMLEASEVLHKRIPTLVLLREKWLADTSGLWKAMTLPQTLAVDWGLRLWGEEQDKRQAFLMEYTRRIETTNLRALDRLRKVTAADFDGRYFARAMDKYFADIKRRRSYSNMSVLDMVPLHYYGWVLINGKQNK